MLNAASTANEYSLSAATMDTTMEVVVEELCSNTVTSTPIIKLPTGLLRTSFWVKLSPAVLPAQSKET